MPKPTMDDVRKHLQAAYDAAGALVNAAKPGPGGIYESIDLLANQIHDETGHLLDLIQLYTAPLPDGEVILHTPEDFEMPQIPGFHARIIKGDGMTRFFVFGEEDDDENSD